MNISKIDRYVNKTNPWTKVYGLARSIIALAELLTILTNHMYYFFNYSTSSESMLIKQGWSVFRLTGVSTQGLLLAKIVFIAILVSVISGYYPQITAPLHLWLAYSDYTIMVPSDGGSEVAVVILTLLIPIALTDSRKNHWYTPQLTGTGSLIRQPLAVSFYFLIRLQIALIYIDAVVQKLPIKQWMNGTSVYYYFSNDMFGLPPFLQGITHWLITTKLVVIPTYGALLTEIILAFLLVVPRKFWIPFFITGSLMHITFAIFIGIPSFSMIMIGALVIYLIPLDYSFKNIPFLKKQERHELYETI